MTKNIASLNNLALAYISDEIFVEGAFAFSHPPCPTRSYGPIFKAFITSFHTSGNVAYKSHPFHNLV